MSQEFGSTNPNAPKAKNTSLADSNLMLFSGNANPVLAQDVANYLKMPMGQASCSRFSMPFSIISSVMT